MNHFRRITLLLIVFIVSFSSAQAQKGGWDSSPEELAARQTTMMTDSLSLSDAQIEKVSEVNLKYAKKMSAARMEARENADGDWEAMRETMRVTMATMLAEQKTELQKYLTSEQAKKWEQVEIAQREKRREGGNKGGKGRKGGKGGKDKKQTEQKI
jgi:hypothetical protein